MEKTILSFLVLFFWAADASGQRNTFLLESGDQKIPVNSITGLDLSGSTTSIQTRTLSRTGSLPVSKTLTLQKVKCLRESDLFRWFSTVNQTPRQKRDIRVSMVNSNGETVKSWKIYQASPQNMYVPPSMIAKGNDVSIDTLRLTFEKIEPDW